MYIISLWILCFRAEMYNTRVRRSIWISTPSGMHYQSHIMPSHDFHPQVFIPYHKDLKEAFDDNRYLSHSDHYLGSKIDEDFERGKDNRKHYGQNNSRFHKLKSGLYNTLFGGGISRILFYTLIAVSFTIIGYHIRKKEEYSSYIRLPTPES